VFPIIEESESLNARAATEEHKRLTRGAFADLAEDVGLLHGRLSAAAKERVMRAFRDGEITILVSTSVIEVGIDVPNATVMLIEGAERFGLAQLHQLRGRVGRSHHRAYAYLIVPPRRAMSADAVKRLEAIESLEDLGIGFTLATHDLEIRGAGELLGDEQSGQIQAVGYSLYTSILERAVNALRAGRSPELDRPLDHGAEVDLRVPALIPEDFLPDVHTRLLLYKRIASAASKAELDELQVEMVDRFGILPDPARMLFRITELKLKATPLGVKRIEFGSKGGRIVFSPRPAVDPGNVVRLLQEDPVSYRLDGAEKIRLTAQIEDEASRIVLLHELLDRLALPEAA